MGTLKTVIVRHGRQVEFSQVSFPYQAPGWAVIDDVLSPLGVLPYITPAFSVETEVPPSLISFVCGCFCSEKASAVVRPGVSFPDEPL